MTTKQTVLTDPKYRAEYERGRNAYDPIAERQSIPTLVSLVHSADSELQRLCLHQPTSEWSPVHPEVLARFDAALTALTGRAPELAERTRAYLAAVNAAQADWLNLNEAGRAARLAWFEQTGTPR